jgi:FtsH-binding integral membrane protein
VVWHTDHRSVTIIGEDGGKTVSTSEQSQIRTRMFARVLGPFFTIVPTTVAVRGSYMQTLFNEFKANPMWPWLYGAILLMFGLVIIAFHQYWRSPAAIIVSVVGWFLAIRGLLLLTVPRAYDAAGNALYSSGAIALIWVLFICLASAGLYLTYVGWKPESGTPKTVASPSQDRADAAGS